MRAQARLPPAGPVGGSHIPPSDSRGRASLRSQTPQELQIALALAGGKTTREIAAALFLSPKTVEYHLRHVYQKFGIHSREELAQALATNGS